MWKCEKCGREFKRINQQHYCGNKPKTIDEYIYMQDEDKQNDLWILKEIIEEILIDVEKRISWSMPTYWKKYNLVNFAAHKKHIGLYVDEEIIEKLKDELINYKTSKGCIHIPYGKIDKELIKRIMKYVKDNI